MMPAYDSAATFHSTTCENALMEITRMNAFMKPILSPANPTVVRPMALAKLMIGMGRLDSCDEMFGSFSLV